MSFARVSITLVCSLLVLTGCAGPQEADDEPRVTNSSPDPDNCEWYHPPPPPLPDGRPNHTAVRLIIEDGSEQQLSVRVTAPDGSYKSALLGGGNNCEPSQSADGLEVECQDARWDIVGQRTQVVVLRGERSVATFPIDSDKALAFEVQRL